ncbi:phage tail spike protein [Clostridium baratii]|uniref:Phage minor structural protein n=1 Tax=Clostridium baratii TaxID=1561 RepID=A0A174QTH1_9CLOT|nr:phage tail spike protein [Clostridium baratii]CUP74198.1 phage minor structural protein [Clostridium baratii]
MAKTIKIAIFNKKATKDQVLFSNGDALDNICIMCSIDENIVTGEYTLDATFLIDEESKLHDLIEEEAILKVKVDYGYEIFRIRRVDKDTRDMQVVASQITITETLSLQLEDVRPENQNGLSALQWMLDKSKGVKEITLFSDIETINTAYYEDMNMYKAIHDCDQSFLNRWGGEILRRGYTLNINKRIGQDRGFTVMHGKNLTGFELSSNIDSVVTRIKPKGFNGITIDGYVNSGLIDKYARVHTATIKYDDIKVKDESNSEGFDTLEQAQEELIKRAKEEFTKKHIDEIFAEYRVNFAHLEKTEEYKNYAVLERVYLGDSIKVKVKKLDIDITVRAIRRIYDVLRQAVEEIELSNEDISEKRKEAPPTIGELVNRIENVDENSKNFLQEAKDHATNLIKNGLKDSCVIVKENEILIMDTKDINTATKVWRWNINGLGYSSTGYYGEYGTAITMDGQIVANFITTGLLTANVIRAGVIRSKNDNLSIDLDNGIVNFTKGFIRGLNSSWDLSSGVLKSIGKSWNGLPSELIITNGGLTSNDILEIISKGGSMYISSANKNSGSSLWIGLDDNNTGVSNNLVFTRQQAAFNKKVYASYDVQVIGNLKVNGSKNCIQKTKEYGDVPFYANEDINSLLTKTPVDEVYETKLYETGKYKCIVKISEMIRECINTDIPYNVWLSKLGEGDIWINNTYNGYFVVESNRPVKFKYKIEGRRKGFENMNEQLVFDKLYKTEIKEGSDNYNGTKFSKCS